MSASTLQRFAASPVVAAIPTAALGDADGVGVMVVVAAVAVVAVAAAAAAFLAVAVAASAESCRCSRVSSSSMADVSIERYVATAAEGIHRSSCANAFFIAVTSLSSTFLFRL